jgi:hypothetical protein
MLPGYGVGLRNFLFENTPEKAIRAKIKEQVSIFLQQITITSLQVKKGAHLGSTVSGNSNTLFVKLKYHIKGTQTTDIFNLVENTVI